MSRPISIQNVSQTFGAFQALASVNLEIGAGEFVSFIGPSGCGKTTLLRLVSSLEQPTGGTVLIGGETPVRQAVRDVVQAG